MPKEEPQPFDPEALIRAVLPGGHSCDPQAVADDIREWVRGCAAPARVPLTDEEIQQGFEAYERSESGRYGVTVWLSDFTEGVHFAERAHGIGVTATNGDPHGE